MNGVTEEIVVGYTLKDTLVPEESLENDALKDRPVKG